MEYINPTTGNLMIGLEDGTSNHYLGDAMVVGTRHVAKRVGISSAFNPSSTLKFTTQGFKTPSLTMKGYTTQTIYKSPSSSIETVTDGKNGKPESINVKTGFLNFSISVGMDGSVAVGNSFVSIGSTLDGKGILDLSIPTGSHTSSRAV